jgi:replicative DNA helicase
MLTDPIHTTLYAEYYDKRWFSQNDISVITDIAMQYYKATSEVPSITTLEALFERLVERGKKLDVQQLSMSLHTAMNYDIDEYSPDFLNSSILSFVKSKVIYWAFWDNFRELKDNNDLTKCLPVFEQVNNLSFDMDFGMDYFDDWEQHKEYLQSPENKISTGYDALDELMYGGLPAEGKVLVVPIAQPGMGKSMLLSNMCVNLMKQGKNVLIVSLEMSQDIYANRIDALVAKEHINMLKHNIDSVEDKVYNFGKESGSKLYIKEYPPNSINCNHIKTYLERVNNKLRKDKTDGKLAEDNSGKIDIIMVDYISLLNSALFGNTESMYIRVGSVAKELRALSYHFAAPVISPQQINGEGLGSCDIEMSHVSESKAINHHADFIGALCRQEGDKEAGILRFKILKNRFGGRAGTFIQWATNMNTLSISNWDTSIHVEPLDEPESIGEDSIMSDLHKME